MLILVIVFFLFIYVETKNPHKSEDLIKFFITSHAYGCENVQAYDRAYDELCDNACNEVWDTSYDNACNEDEDASHERDSFS